MCFLNTLKFLLGNVFLKHIHNFKNNHKMKTEDLPHSLKERSSPCACTPISSLTLPTKMCCSPEFGLNPSFVFP